MTYSFCHVGAQFYDSAIKIVSKKAQGRLDDLSYRIMQSVEPDVMRIRAEYLAWHAIREFAPPVLEVSGMRDRAQKLRGLDGGLKQHVPYLRRAHRYAANRVYRGRRPGRSNPLHVFASDTLYFATEAAKKAPEVRYASKATDVVRCVAECVHYALQVAIRIPDVNDMGDFDRVCRESWARQIVVEDRVVAIMDSVLSIGQ